MPGPDRTILHKVGRDTGLAITNALATTAEIDNRQGDAIGILLTAHATAVSLAIHVSDVKGGTYAALHTTADAAVAVTVSANTRAYALPDTVRAFPFIKLVANAGSATITVVRKS